MNNASPTAALDRILAHTRFLLLDFDGTLCDLFAGTPTGHVADDLREVITREGVPLPPPIQASSDWFAILAYAASADGALGARTAAKLTALELSAVPTARPAAYAHDVITAARESGRSAAIVSNNSDEAVRAYLNRHSLTGQVSAIAARTSYDTALKPNPHLIHQAMTALKADPAACAMIGDTAADIQAAHAAGIPSIGYATTPDTATQLTSTGAGTIIGTLANLALRLRARPLPN